MALQDQSVLSRLLEPNERLLWSGRPRRFVFRSEDRYLVPGAVVWSTCWLVLCWISASKLAGKVPTPVVVLVYVEIIPAISLGIYVAVGRFFWEAFVRSRTYYGVSDRRALIAVRLPGAKPITLPLDAVQYVGARNGPRGCGTVSLGYVGIQSLVSIFAGTVWPGWRAYPAFEFIDDAMAARDTLLEAKLAWEKRSHPSGRDQPTGCGRE
jgi:hypothetical protein